MSTLDVSGCQPIHIDRDGTGTVWLYMGDNFVALSPDQWRRFARMVAVASGELPEAGVMTEVTAYTGQPRAAGPEPEAGR